MLNSVIVFSLLWLGFGMGYIPLDDDQLKEWRSQLERFADGSDRDRQLVELLVLARQLREEDNQRKQAIADIFQIVYQSRSLSCWLYLGQGVAQKTLNYLANAGLFLYDNIAAFEPDRKDKNDDFIGVNLCEKICCWLKYKLKKEEINHYKEENKRKKELVLDKSIGDEGNVSLGDQIPYLSTWQNFDQPLSETMRSIDNLDGWANLKPEEPLTGVFWKYLADDPDDRLKNYQYKNLNYHVFAQWLFQNRGNDSQEDLPREERSKQSERILTSTLEQIAEYFEIKSGALTDEYYSNFRFYVASLFVDLAIKNEEIDIAKLNKAIAVDRQFILRGCHIRGYPRCNAGASQLGTE